MNLSWIPNTSAPDATEDDYGGTVIEQVTDRFRAGLITGASASGG